MGTLRAILMEVHTRRVSVRCDLSRTNAELIAMAACLGLITTRKPGAQWGRQWLITSRGLTWLHQQEDL